MAHIILTEVCNRSCPYCFAKQYMEGTEDKTAISWENIIYIANFLDKSNVKKVSFLGGEPLLHPQIEKIITYFIERGFYVCVFTNGMMPQKKYEALSVELKKIDTLNKNRITFMVNVNEPRFSSEHELKKTESFLFEFHEFCALSFNIYRLDFNLDFLIEYILNFGLRRHVRFGIANPIVGSKNEYIHPNDFKKVKVTLMKSLKKMSAMDIAPGLDCGFPLCMFTDEDLGKLYRYTRNAVSFECGPVIDIGTDLTCWSCFPFSNIHTKSLKEFKDYDEAYNYFDMVQQQYRREINGIYESCSNCTNRLRTICSGGCLAHVVNMISNENNLREIE